MNTPRIEWSDYFTSVVDVWVVWAVGLVLLAWAIRHAFRRAPWRGVRAFAADERGASYALSYVLTFPAYLMLMCLILQATLILMVKVGTVYAAYSAARTAVVWRPSQPDRPAAQDDRDGFTQKRAQRAAAMAMAPFATGFEHHLSKMHPFASFDLISQADALAYYSMYERIASDSSSRSGGHYLAFLNRFNPKAIGSRDYVKNKLKFAAASTKVVLANQAITPWNQGVEVTVTYEMPMHVPAVGRVFGSWSRPFFAREVSTTVTLPSEAAETASGRLGIPYDPRDLQDPISMVL